MKKVILVSMVSILFTGCAQMQHSLQVSMLSPTERAKYDCAQFGFKIGTVEYARCVQETTANIRTIKNTPRAPTNWQCQNFMGTVSCQGS